MAVGIDIICRALVCVTYSTDLLFLKAVCHKAAIGDRLAAACSHTIKPLEQTLQDACTRIASPL